MGQRVELKRLRNVCEVLHVSPKGRMHNSNRGENDCGTHGSYLRPVFSKCCNLISTGKKLNEHTMQAHLDNTTID